MKLCMIQIDYGDQDYAIPEYQHLVNYIWCNHTGPFNGYGNCWERYNGSYIMLGTVAHKDAKETLYEVEISIEQLLTCNEERIRAWATTQETV